MAKAKKKRAKIAKKAASKAAKKNAKKGANPLEESGITSFDGSNFVRPTSLLKAWALEADGDLDAARRAYTEARSVLADARAGRA